MDEKKKMLLADFALLLAATFWGMGFVAGDMAAKAFPTFWIMAVRFLGAAFWMGLLFRRAVKSSMKEDIKAGMILGGLLFLAQPLQIIALRYTTPSKQAFLVTTYVVIVPFISWLVLRKRPQNKAFAAGAMALFGIGLISLSGSLCVELGDALSLLFALDDGKAHTQKQICEEWIIPRTTINTVVKECVELGYVELEQIDRSKEKLVRLTEKGMQYTQQVLELFYRSENEAMRRTLEIHSPDFIDSLTSYADFLQEEIKKKPQQEGINKK